MADRPPNVLVLMSDQHSFRHLEHRGTDDGGEDVKTPNLSGLITSSASFDNAYCSSPLCTPSRLSLLTGRYAQGAGAWGNWSVLPPGLTTFPETLSETGYDTCLLGKMHLGGNRQFAGFDYRPYGDLTGQTGHQAEPPNRKSDRLGRLKNVGVTNIPESLLQEQNVVQETVSFLREQRHSRPSNPWMLFASFSRPHWPRTAPQRHFDRYWPDQISEPKVTEESATFDHPASEKIAEMTFSREIDDEDVLKSRAGYFACVDYLDEIIGDLLTTLENDGFLENTIVVYLSDHGELAGEHGLWEKGTWHEASCRVPFSIQLPEHRTGELPTPTFQTPVSLIDLFPTICGLTNTEVPPGLDGRDISAAIQKSEEPDSEPIYVDMFDWRGSEELQYRMVRRDNHKYVRFRDAPDLFFDLDTDPLEKRNLIEGDRSDENEALQELRKIAEESLDFEAANEKRKSDANLREEFVLPTTAGNPNQYMFPDERIVDADTPLYQPHVICERPDIIYDDYSG